MRQRPPRHGVAVESLARGDGKPPGDLRGYRGDSQRR